MVDLMDSLQYAGLGGKRTSGLGSFELSILPLPDILKERIFGDYSRYLSLSTSFPSLGEISTIDESSKYLIMKTSGFAYSEASNELLRKQDYYKFKSGSTFPKRFAGDIVDVRPECFPHPVWNYSKGLFFGFEIDEVDDETY